MGNPSSYPSPCEPYTPEETVDNKRFTYTPAIAWLRQNLMCEGDKENLNLTDPLDRFFKESGPDLADHDESWVLRGRGN